ncbi:hypothetical protein ACIPVK_20420 [Paeniglutamicibacter sp. MACA_103]|uniref:hypothetical protein n=1 Tax=Paeniglutamicibacter sp. MACA_103 TaxID=3377337 RepID=UPI003894EEE4
MEKVTGTLVETIRDDMAQVIWELVRTRIIDPALEAVDLSLSNRSEPLRWAALGPRLGGINLPFTLRS